MDEGAPGLKDTVSEVGTSRRHCVVESSIATKKMPVARPADVEKVPCAGDPDRVPVAGERDERRDIPGIVLRRPEAIGRHHDRRETNRFRARRAVIVEVQPRMVHQDREAAPDEERDEEEIEKVAVADPHRKPVWAGRRGFVVQRHGRNGRHAEQGALRPGQEHRDRDEDQDGCQNDGRIHGGIVGPLGDAPLGAPRRTPSCQDMLKDARLPDESRALTTIRRLAGADRDQSWSW